MGKFIKKNNYNIFVFFVFLLFFAIANYYSPIESLDELWKYNHSKALLDGYIPYKDLNLITTPFYFVLTMLFLLFNKTLIGFRLYSCLFNGMLFFLLYLLIKKNCNKKVSFILSLFTLSFLTISDKFIYVFDYNKLFLLLILCCILLETTMDKNSIRYYFYLGILYSLLVLTKQSSGGILFIMATIYFLIKNKKTFKNICYYMFGFFIPNFIFLVYLLINNAFGDFLNYCLFGLNNFTNNKITFIDLFFTNVYFCMLCCLVICSLIFIIVYFFKSKDILPLFYFISIGFISYPICDMNHFNLLVIYSIYSNCLVLSYLLKNKNINSLCGKLFILNKTKFWYIFAFTFSFVIYFSMYVNPIIFTNNYKKGILPNIENIYITPKCENNYLSLSNYIEENYDNEKVLFISSNAVVLSTINDTHTGVFDIFLNGNLGTVSGIEHIKNAMIQKDVICISNNYKEENWQNINEVYDYIIENYKCIDEFNEYSFYTK